MADKTKTSGPAGTAPTVENPEGIRNVAVVGHSSSGKTTLAESLLLSAGVIQRQGRVEDGTSVSDYDEVEARQQRSVNLSLLSFRCDGKKINLLDTPGYADFVGDLRAGLRAADAALFVISAADGVDGATRQLWEECATVGMPRAVVVSKLDHQRADFDDVVAQCTSAFGAGVAPIYMPIVEGEGNVRGLLGLLSGKLFDYSSGTREEAEPTAQQREDAGERRDALIEGIIQESEDETLMDRYLEGEEIDPGVLIADLEKAVARGSFFPVLATASLQAGGAAGAHGIGIAELCEILTQAFPSPLERPLPEVSKVGSGETVSGIDCDPNGPLLAEAVKTTSDPYVGRVSLVRVFSGTLRPDTQVHICGHGMEDRGHADHDDDEKIGAVTAPLGKQQRQMETCIAGDICAVAKLTKAYAGDTLSDKDAGLLLAPWTMPEPLLPVAINAASKADEDKMSQALSRLTAEDGTLRLENNAETGQLVLWCMGEAHVDVVLDRLKNRYSVEVTTGELRVPLRETFATPSKGLGRNVKQTGGHGEYGICHIEVEPRESGEGFEFVDKIVGGVIPRQFIPSVEKGVRAQMAQGVLAGYPMVDVRVTLVDGKAHSVDSSDMAFQKAGRLALRDAAEKAKISLLEPVDEISVLVDDEFVGAVMSDLSSRRGRVNGTEPVAGGRTQVKAEVPELEIVRYAIDLRSMSHGTGSFSRHYLRYEPLPSHLADKIVKEASG